jgi:selenocysteine lyase/cysteine desulfurase
VGIEQIHAHDLRLANLVREGLGVPPGDSAVVSVESEGAVRVLNDAGLRVAGLAGNARMCFHLYNDEDDVDAVLRALSGRASAPAS